MEIQNTQIGQNFAGTSGATDSQTLPSAEVLRQTEQQNDVINTQVRQENADNQSSERQDRDIELAVQEVQSFLQVQNRNLDFSFDENSNRSVVTVKDSSSGDVIRQIPSDEVLRLAERIQDLQQDIGSSVGVFVNRQV